MMKKIVLLATGGTISSVGTAFEANLKACLKGEQLKEEIPELNHKNYAVEVQNYSIVNSTALTPSEMIEIAQSINRILLRDDVQAVVVTHGTSLMEETAFVLDTLIESRDKPVVVTGAQRNATYPWPDGKSNLYDAFVVAADPLSRKMGVIVVFNGGIFEGFRLRKVHTASLDAFSAGEYGKLGCVYFDKVFYYRERTHLHLPYSCKKNSSVAIIPFYSGADDSFFNTVIERKEDGIIVEGVGLGNVSEKFYAGIKKARENHIPVVVTTRCENGPIIPMYSYCGGGASLQKLGVLFSDYPSTHARLLLLMLLNSGISPEKYFVKE